MNKIQEKLIKFEKYLKRKQFRYSHEKKDALFRFHEIFMEEMKGTESGNNFLDSLDT